MKFVYLILARKGSVRIKNKNLKKIKNKSLVEYSIDFAKGKKLIKLYYQQTLI